MTHLPARSGPKPARTSGNNELFRRLQLECVAAHVTESRQTSMMPHPTILGFLTTLVLSLCSAASCAADDAKTNVVLILIDDLGCNGSEYYQTPHIDRLAAEGMRFTNGYAACNVCSPTRAAIMTGKYPARLLLTQRLPAGRWSRTGNKKREDRYLGHLPLEEITVAEAMCQAGFNKRTQSDRIQ
jgi:hypothetical protein